MNNGSYGATIRKGLSQIQEWDIWLESNFSQLIAVFKKHLSPKAQLPDEFRELDKTRIHYIVVVGRRKDFNDKTRRLNRNYLGVPNSRIMHYDRLADEAKLTLKNGNF